MLGLRCYGPYARRLLHRLRNWGLWPPRSLALARVDEGFSQQTPETGGILGNIDDLMRSLVL